MPTSKSDEYTPLFKEQILKVVSTRKVTHSAWWSTELQCGCPLTELARANGFKFPPGQGKTVLEFNEHNLGHNFNMQAAFIEAFDNYPQTNPPLTAYQICERIFA